MSWWVGGYIEAGASASGSSGTPYYPFVFQAADHAQAVANDGAKLLAGPFGTQQAAQNWATAYERNPATVHAGSGLSSGTGTVTGDKPPAGVPTGIAAVGAFFNKLSQGSTWLRLAEGILGVLLISVGIAHMTRVVPIATHIAKAVA